jgi:hypothetical protein
MITLTKEMADKILNNGDMKVKDVYFGTFGVLFDKFTKFVDEQNETNVIIETIINIKTGKETNNYYSDDLSNEAGIMFSLKEQMRRDPEGWYYRSGDGSITKIK